MHLDGTGLAVLDRDAASAIKLGTLWGYIGGEADAWTAVYLYTSTGKKLGQREGEKGPEDVLKLRVGFTVADASSSSRRASGESSSSSAAATCTRGGTS